MNMDDESVCGATAIRMFRLGIERMISLEREDLAKWEQLRAAAQPYDPPTPRPAQLWADTLKTFDRATERAADLVAKHPRFFTPYSLGLLYEISDPGSADSPLKQLATVENLEAGIKSVMVINRRHLPLREGAACTTTLRTVGFLWRGESTPEHKIKDPAETLAFYLLGAHWKERYAGRTAWLDILRTARCWGWGEDPRAREPAELSAESVTQCYENLQGRIRRLLKRRYRRSVRVLARWHRTAYHDGWGPGLTELGLRAG